MTQSVRFDTSGSTRTLQTSAERETIGAAAVYASNHGTESCPEEEFIDRLPAARRSICHRLVRGLLRGTPDEIPPSTILSTRSPTLPDDVHDSLRTIGADELLQLLPPLPEPCRYVAFLPFPASEAILAAPIKTIHGYDRFHLVGPVHLLTDTETGSDPHPVDLIPLLKREGAFADDDQVEKITEELAESVANLALARLSSPANTNLASEAPSTPDSVFTVLEELPGADPASAFERLAVEGHPFHPGAKIRRGMTPAESLLYAPEFTDTIDVRFVAVETQYTLQSQTDQPLTDILYDQFTGLEAAVQQATPTDRTHDEYAVIPIHPWQYYHVIPDRYAEQIAQNRVVPLPEYTWPATPLLNTRTVVPYAPDDPRADPLPHLKLAVDVQLTNVVRTVSPQAVYNSPRVTDLTDTILARESFETLGMLSERAATCYHAPGGPHPDGEEFDNSRNLSGLARENPYSHPFVSDDADPVAVGSLLAISPVTDQPIICDVLDRFTTGNNTSESAMDAQSFFRSYVKTVVPEQLLLLSKYGIALETHPQNTYVAFDDGDPVATLVRDLGGIRVLDDRLSWHNLEFNAYPDSDVDAYGPRDLYNKLYYALFQNHFAELIVALTEHTALDEGFCWEYIRTCCQETFQTLRSKPDIPDEWVDQDEEALFEDPTIHKALTAMRLQGKRHEYVTSRISNPLAQSGD